MKRRWWGLVALLIVLAAPFLAQLRSGPSGEEVEVARVAGRVIQRSTLASGTLIYDRQAQLSPEVIGRVTSVQVKEGDRVAVGQVILTIDDQSYRAEVEQREAVVRLQHTDIDQSELAVADRRRKFARAEELIGRGFVSKANFEDLRFALQSAEVGLRMSLENLRSAEAALRQARDQLSKTVIRAPIAGTVIQVSIKTGETAVPSTIGIAGSSLVTVANTGTLIAELNVDEADIAQVEVGQKVSIHASAYPDQALIGTVQSLPLSARNADGTAGMGGGSSARTYSVKVQVSETGSVMLRPGMTCRAEIFSRSGRRMLSVPIQAVVAANRDDPGAASKDDGGEDESYVFVVVDSTARRRIVRTGEADDSFQAMQSGLKPGEMVVSGPYRVLRNLQDGDQVNPKMPAEAKPLP